MKTLNRFSVTRTVPRADKICQPKTSASYNKPTAYISPSPSADGSTVNRWRMGPKRLKIEFCSFRRLDDIDDHGKWYRVYDSYLCLIVTTALSFRYGYTDNANFSATSRGHSAMLIGGFNFQHGVSYNTHCSAVTICLKRTVFALSMGQTNGRKDRSALLN